MTGLAMRRQLQKVNTLGDRPGVQLFMTGTSEVRYDFMSRRFAFFSPGAPAGHLRSTAFTAIVGGFSFLARPIARVLTSRNFQLHRFTTALCAG